MQQTIKGKVNWKNILFVFYLKEMNDQRGKAKKQKEKTKNEHLFATLFVIAIFECLDETQYLEVYENE